MTFQSLAYRAINSGHLPFMQAAVLFLVENNKWELADDVANHVLFLTDGYKERHPDSVSKRARSIWSWKQV